MQVGKGRQQRKDLRIPYVVLQAEPGSFSREFPLAHARPARFAWLISSMTSRRASSRVGSPASTLKVRMALIGGQARGLRKIHKNEEFFLACRCRVPFDTGAVGCIRMNKSSSVNLSS